MILVDMSVWIAFFKGDPKVKSITIQLEQLKICTHDFVIGEMAMGHLGLHRQRVLDSFRFLKKIPEADLFEVLSFVEKEKLYARGLSWVDVHLLFSALEHRVSLWTQDRQLLKMARNWGLAYEGR
ncbi:MAG: PIN domain-containing protein [Deltaproteobacteria bacterium]|nr:PIN domain-containing protein [Deltaproteobacteria bacterium]